MKINTKNHSSGAFSSIGVFICAMVIFFIIVMILESAKQVQATHDRIRKEGAEQTVGHPVSITTLSNPTYLTVVGSYKGLNGRGYLTVLLNTNTIPTLLDISTNEVSRHGLYLYDGKTFTFVPKLE